MVHHMYYSGSNSSPQDRGESLYWFNRLGDPTATRCQEQRKLPIVSARPFLAEIFFRPAASVRSGPRSPSSCKWHLNPAANWRLVVHNSTPHHVTLSQSAWPGMNSLGIWWPCSPTPDSPPAKLRVPPAPDSELQLIRPWRPTGTPDHPGVSNRHAEARTTPRPSADRADRVDYELREAAEEVTFNGAFNPNLEAIDVSQFNIIRLSRGVTQRISISIRTRAGA